jgi:hypothetical protein
MRAIIVYLGLLLSMNADATVGGTRQIDAGKIRNGSAVLTLPSSTDTLVGKATTDQLTNKDIDGGTASNTSRVTLPKSSTSTLSGLTRKQGTIIYDTDKNKAVIDNGSTLSTIGGGGGGIFSVSTNLLSNSSWEDDTSGWTASGGAYTRTTTAANLVPPGIGAGSWDSSSASQTLTSAATTVTSSDGLSSRSIAGSCALKCASGTCTHKIQLYDGTNVLAEATITSGTSNFARTSINGVAPASGTIALRLISVASDEPTLYSDDCYLGLAEGFNLGIISQFGEWTTYTPTFTGFGTVSTQSFRYRTAPQGLEFQGRFTAGTTTATEARLSYPSVCTSASDYTTLEGIGNVYEGNSGAAVFYALAEPSQAYMTFGIQSGSIAALAKQNGNTIIASSGVLSVHAYVRCQGFQSNQVYRADQVAGSWSGYHDNTCSWSRTNVAFGDPTADSTCTFTERRNINFGSVTSALSGSDKLPGITFTPKKANTSYFICYQGNAINGSANIQVGNRLWDGTTVVADFQNQVNSSTSVYPIGGCGIYYASSISPVTLKVQTASSSSSINMTAGTYGNSIEWSIFAVDGSFPGMTFAGLVSSSSTGPERVERITFAGASESTACSGTCAVYRSSVSGVTVTRTGAGTYTINFPSGTFSAVPTCTGSLIYAILGGYVLQDTTGSTATSSSTSVPIVTQTGGGTNTNAGASLICMGPR